MFIPDVISQEKQKDVPKDCNVHPMDNIPELSWLTIKWKRIFSFVVPICESIGL